MNVESQRPPGPVADEQEAAIRARTGQRWAALFWIPLLLLALSLAILSHNADSHSAKPLLIVGLALPPLAVLLFAGRWWATRGLGVSDWSFLLAAIAQGLVMFLSAFLVLVAALGLDGDHGLFDKWTWTEFELTFVGWGICSIWTLALGGVVVWRVRRGKAALLSSEENNRASGSRRFAIMFVSSLGIPVLLCAPIALMLRYDASLHRSANAILAGQIRTIDAQITDIKDLNRVLAQLLARKQVVQALEPYAVRAADALGIFGQLPGGVQLLSLEMKERHLALAIRSVPKAELAVVELLSQRGYRDVKIAARQHEGDDGIEQMTIEASSTRGDSQ